MRREKKTLHLYVCSHLRTRIHTYAERVTPCAASACHTQKPVPVSDLFEASLKAGRHQQAALAAVRYHENPVDSH